MGSHELRHIPGIHFQFMQIFGCKIHRVPGINQPMPQIDHSLTHFDWHLEPVQHRLPARITAAQRGTIEAALPAGRWCRRDEALALALPAPMRRLLS